MLASRNFAADRSRRGRALCLIEMEGLRNKISHYHGVKLFEEPRISPRKPDVSQFLKRCMIRNNYFFDFSAGKTPTKSSVWNVSSNIAFD